MRSTAHFSRHSTASRSSWTSPRAGSSAWRSQAKCTRVRGSLGRPVERLGEVVAGHELLGERPVGLGQPQARLVGAHPLPAQRCLVGGDRHLRELLGHLVPLPHARAPVDGPVDEGRQRAGHERAVERGERVPARRAGHGCRAPRPPPAAGRRPPASASRRTPGLSALSTKRGTASGAARVSRASAHGPRARLGDLEPVALAVGVAADEQHGVQRLRAERAHAPARRAPGRAPSGRRRAAVRRRPPPAGSGR